MNNLSIVLDIKYEKKIENNILIVYDEWFKNQRLYCNLLMNLFCTRTNNSQDL